MNRSIFHFLWFVPSWEQGQKLEKPAVMEQSPQFAATFGEAVVGFPRLGAAEVEKIRDLLPHTLWTSFVFQPLNPQYMWVIITITKIPRMEKG